MVGHVGRQLYVLGGTVQRQGIPAGFTFGVYAVFRYGSMADVKRRVVDVFFKFIAYDEGIRWGYGRTCGRGCRGSIHRSVYRLDGVIICLSFFSLVVHESRIGHVACDYLVTVLRVFRTQHGVSRVRGVSFVPGQKDGRGTAFGFHAGRSVYVPYTGSDTGLDEAPEL